MKGGIYKWLLNLNAIYEVGVHFELRKIIQHCKLQSRIKHKNHTACYFPRDARPAFLLVHILLW